jgi:hypothetical protein
MLDERDDVADNENIEEVDSVQNGDVVVDWVRYKDVESTLVTSKNNNLNQDLLMLHLSLKAFKHFKRKHDLGMHKVVKLL